MRTLATALLLATALSVAVAIAQTYPGGNPQAVALTCSYNSSGLPTPTPGKFYYVQCNSSGQLVIQ